MEKNVREVLWHFSFHILLLISLDIATAPADVCFDMG